MAKKKSQKYPNKKKYKRENNKDRESYDDERKRSSKNEFKKKQRTKNKIKPNNTFNYSRSKLSHYDSVNKPLSEDLKVIQLNWKKLNTKGSIPRERGFHSCTVINDKLVIVGGDNRVEYFNDVYFFDIKTAKWIMAPKESHLKFPRTGHTCTNHGQRLYLFGGKCREKYLSDMQVFDLETMRWSRVQFDPKKSGKIQPRGAHTASVVNNKLFIFGGLTPKSIYEKDNTNPEYLNNLIVFNFDTHHWETPEVNGEIPSPRAGHSATVVGKYVYIFGGRHGSLLLQDTYVLNTETMTWKKVHQHGAIPSTRAGHSMNSIDDKLLLVWGGSDWSNFFSGVHILDLDSCEWVECAITGNMPDARFWHTSCLFNDKLYVFGGGHGKGLYNDLHMLDVQPLLKLINIRKEREQNLSEKQITKLPEPEQSYSETTKLKIVYNNETRAIRIPSNQLTYENVMKRIHEELKRPSLILQYIDEEGDRITIRSNDEFQESIDYFKKEGKALKLDVQDDPSASSTIDGQDYTFSFQSIDPPIQKPKQELKLKNPIHGAKIRWQQGVLLGSGAYGNVYLGLIPETGKFIAVKQVRLPSDRQRQKVIQELMNEINLMKDLNNEHIVQYLGAEITDRYLNILMEYVDGGSIAKLLQNFKSLHESTVRLYTRQILFGLKFLHDRGIIHRDIKGANILVDNRGVVKLADFGHSKNILLHDQTKHSIRGTPLWMAPEVIKYNMVSKAGDIWSLGCTIIEMLTGDVPWSDLKTYEPYAAMMKIASQNCKPPIPESLSPAGKKFLDRCFCLDPRRRATVDELLQHEFITQPYDGSIHIEENNQDNSSSDQEYDSFLSVSTLGFESTKQELVDSSSEYEDGLQVEDEEGEEIEESEEEEEPVKTTPDVRSKELQMLEQQINSIDVSKLKIITKSVNPPYRSKPQTPQTPRPENIRPSLIGTTKILNLQRDLKPSSPVIQPPSLRNVGRHIPTLSSSAAVGSSTEGTKARHDQILRFLKEQQKASQHSLQSLTRQKDVFR